MGAGWWQGTVAARRIHLRIHLDPPSPPIGARWVRDARHIASDVPNIAVRLPRASRRGMAGIAGTARLACRFIGALVGHSAGDHLVSPAGAHQCRRRAVAYGDGEEAGAIGKQEGTDLR